MRYIAKLEHKGFLNKILKKLKLKKDFYFELEILESSARLICSNNKLFKNGYLEFQHLDEFTFKHSNTTFMPANMPSLFFLSKTNKKKL